MLVVVINCFVDGGMNVYLIVEVWKDLVGCLIRRKFLFLLELYCQFVLIELLV